MANLNSQFYPYDKVYTGFYDLSQTINIPRKIMDYLLDMPQGAYEPKDDNNRARVRLWKYLYYDGANPLENKLPTPAEKKSVLFNPDLPEEPPTEKGYRLIPLLYVKPSQTDAQTRIYVYMGRTIANNDTHIQLSVDFDIWTHYTEENSTKTANAYSRVFAIEQCIIECLHGVNMAGVGAFYFNRAKHSDCGSQVIRDNNSNVGRHLVLGLEIASETSNDEEQYNTGASLGNGYFG